MEGDGEVLALLAADTDEYTELQLAFMERLPVLAAMLNTYVATLTKGELQKWDIGVQWYDKVRYSFVDAYARETKTGARLSAMEEHFLATEKEEIRAAWEADVNMRRRREQARRNRLGPPRRFVAQQSEGSAAFGQLTPRRPLPASENVRTRFQEIMAKNTTPK